MMLFHLIRTVSVKNENKHAKKKTVERLVHKWDDFSSTESIGGFLFTQPQIQYGNVGGRGVDKKTLHMPFNPTQSKVTDCKCCNVN